MRSIGDEELILHYYGEGDDPAAMQRELERSPELEARYRELCAVLDAVARVEAPEPPLEYGGRLWRRLEPRIIADRWSLPRRLQPLFERGWAVAATAALLVALGIFLGRYSSPPNVVSTTTTASQRILMDTVAGHLLRTEILLLELTNAGDGEELDITTERALAKELSQANRLYREAALNQGHRRTAALLDDLELVFLEVAHASDLIRKDELADIRRRLDERDLLFKVQVVGSRLRRATEPARTDA